MSQDLYSALCNNQFHQHAHNMEGLGLHDLLSLSRPNRKSAIFAFWQVWSFLTVPSYQIVLAWLEDSHDAKFSERTFDYFIGDATTHKQEVESF